MERLSFYKSFYETELRRKDDLDKSINNPILIVTIIFGVLSYISEKINFQFLNKPEMVIIILILIISVLLCISIFHIIISYNNGINGYNYEILGTNTDFESYRKELIEYSQHVENDLDFEKEFEESIISELVKCTDINNKLNIKRTYHIFLSKKYMIIALVIAFVTFIINLLKQVL